MICIKCCPITFTSPNSLQCLMIQPYLDYEWYSNLIKKNPKRNYVSQRRCAMFCLKLNSMACISPKEFFDLKWFPIERTIKTRCQCYYFQVLQWKVSCLYVYEKSNSLFIKSNFRTKCPIFYYWLHMEHVTTQFDIFTHNSMFCLTETPKVNIFTIILFFLGFS